MMVTFFWKGRDGSKNTVQLHAKDQSEDFTAIRERAMKEWGYPGHAGGWQNWLVDDFHKLLTRLLRD